MVRNIRTLLLARGWSENYLAKRCNMQQRSLNHFMQPGSTVSPKINTAERVARGLEVPVWILFLDDIADDIRMWRQMDRFAQTFPKLSREGRDMVMRSLDLESRHTRS